MLFKKRKRGNKLEEIVKKLDELDKRMKKMENVVYRLKKHTQKEKDVNIGVFVDVQNMFYGAKRQYSGRVNFVQLLKQIVRGRRLITAIAYVIENPEIDQSGFFSLLTHHSFRIHKKPLIQRANGSLKGDCDMEMAMDILSLVDKLDVVAIVSGDGDFASLVERVKMKGVKVEVYGFPENTAMNLREVADEFYPIGKELLFR